MKKMQECFNNIPNYKFPLYKRDIISFSHSKSIDRLQFSVRSQYAGTVLGQFHLCLDISALKGLGKNLFVGSGIVTA